MADILMIALMIASIILFAAYVVGCDRIIGREGAGVTGRAATPPSTPPARELERAA